MLDSDMSIILFDDDATSQQRYNTMKNKATIGALATLCALSFGASTAQPPLHEITTT